MQAEYTGTNRRPGKWQFEDSEIDFRQDIAKAIVGYARIKAAGRLIKSLVTES